MVPRHRKAQICLTTCAIALYDHIDKNPLAGHFFKGSSSDSRLIRNMADRNARLVVVEQNTIDAETLHARQVGENAQCVGITALLYLA